MDKTFHEMIVKLKYNKYEKNKMKYVDKTLYHDDPLYKDDVHTWGSRDLKDFKLFDHMPPELRKLNFSTLLDKGDSRAYDEESSR